ncbi:MAG: small basic protein [Planctomycetia bacterium]|nr:small basic protein [Planctomycetia bacterium]
MSIDKSLKRKSGIVQVRSVLTRVERITKMKEEDKWKEGMSPYGIPKTRVLKIVLKKPKKAKAAEGEEGATPAAGAAAAAPAAKKDEKKK